MWIEMNPMYGLFVRIRRVARPYTEEPANQHSWKTPNQQPDSSSCNSAVLSLV